MDGIQRAALEAPEGELTVLNEALIDRAVAHSRSSPRKRVILPFHKHAEDGLQRMLNAVQPGSYIRPHRHRAPPKSEAFLLLRGALAFFVFDDAGGLRECVRLAANGSRFGIDLVPGVYHAFIALEPDTVIYEAKTGPYDAATDKEFAPFAPAEGAPEAAAYMQALLAEYRRRLGLRAPGLAGVTQRPPTLASERLLLRGYEPNDAPGIFAYASDVETTQFVAFETHRSVDDANTFLNSWVAEAYRHGGLEYALCEKDRPERIIGGIGLHADRVQHRTLELGYILARPYWGRGYVPEAAARLIAHAFATTDAQRIEAPIYAPNTRSRRAAEKMGFTLDGVLRSSRAAHAKVWDVAVYSLLLRDYQGWPMGR